MRHLKLFSQFSVMWVLVFVMAAGPLPLGIPRAHAAGPAITDLPGLQNSFYTPKVFIIFDTSKSMAYRPNDPNDDPSAVTDDWDPNFPANNCRNKFCVGKRALYQTLPRYTPRLEIGLSGYSQYYQLTTRPPNLATQCRYDRVALGNSTWGTYKFVAPLLDDLDGLGPTGPVGLASPIFTFTPPGLPASHSSRKWTVGTISGNTSSGDIITKNVSNGGGGSGTTITVPLNPGDVSPGGTKTLNGGSFVYSWYNRVSSNSFGGGIAIVKSGPTCTDPILAYPFGACAGDPCDLTFVYENTVTFPGFTSGTDLGNPYTNATATYTTTGPTTKTFSDSCGQPSPYNGPGAGCDNVSGGCNITQTNGPYNVPVGGISPFYDASYTPPGGWQLVNTTSDTVDVLINTVGVTCPANGTVVTASSGPVEWQSLATGGNGPGTPVGTTGCNAAPGYSCTWTMTLDHTVSGEVNQHYCQFTRQVYNWQPIAQQCDYQTQVWSYSTAMGTTYCNYKFDRDYYSTPTYTYSFLPNDGDLLGTTLWTYTGNDDVSSPGYPSAVTYSNGSFSNGDCPNLVVNSANHPQCSNGVICKLTWAANTTYGGNTYPKGRYSGVPAAYGPGAIPFTASFSQPYPSGEPSASLTDPLFPPTPMDYIANWARATGGRDEYWVTLMAQIYNPTDVNPPTPLFVPADCGGLCSFQESYVQPAGLTITGPRPAAPPVPDLNYQVDAATSSLAPAAFSAVAVTMPPNRNSGWGQLPDQVTPAISWQGVAMNNALVGATPATDGPLLRMVSKYDPVTNPTGLQMPDFGDYTPLTGSLNNVADYLKSYLDTDPYSGCGRKYFVLLLTDGEEQPSNLGNDPVAAVTALRSLTSNGGIGPVDVKTFVIGFGIQSGQLDAMARAGGTAVSTTDPGKVDLVNGVAFNGADQVSLFSSLDITFGKILAGQFTRSKPVVNVLGTEMYVGYMSVLQGLEWQGKLDSIDIKTQALPLLSDGSTSDSSYLYLWRYGDQIDLQPTRNVYTSLNPQAGNRIFFDYAGCSGGSHTCVTAAGWNTNAPADQTTLETLIDSGSPSYAKETIAFLLNKGAPASPELFANGITPKMSRASDIFHAVPAIVEGASQSTTWPDLTESGAYAGFRANPLIANRAKTVYIGANDGMLHAVYDNVTLDSGGFPVSQSGAGQENWAYVPKQLLSILPQMRDQHTYGVDGSVAVADVCGPGFSSSPCTVQDGWRTLLVGALGKGGGGLYALDITDPANPIPKWEVSSPLNMVTSRTFSPRLGETWGAPVIARTQTTTGKPWSVFVGGGVVPGVDTTQAWGNLFYVLDAQTGQVLTDGPNAAAYTIWDDPADPAPNGVASRPTLFRPGDNGLVQRVYFNDTEGKVWRMNLSSPDMTTWKPGNTAADPFFDPASTQAVCALNVNGQPTPILDGFTGAQVVSGVPLTLPIPTVPRAKIYNRPMIAVDSTGSINVYVGTGDSDNPGALGNYDYFYGLTDTGTGCAAPLFVLRFGLSEKVLSEPAFLNNTIFITTYAPVNDPAHICQVGHGYLYAFDARTGLPVLALKDPFNGNAPTSRLDLGDMRNGQLVQRGIPSAPIVRGNKLYVANELDPSHPRQIDLTISPLTVKVRGWQRVK